MQRLIASALCLGISKRELLEDYYMDEIGDVIAAWNALHNPQEDEEETQEVSPFAFFGNGGEML